MSREKIQGRSPEGVDKSWVIAGAFDRRSSRPAFAENS
jgi:hypothetical protein